MRSLFFSFRPKLIIEGTQVCDRACPGCYAPNLISKESPEELVKRFPSYFLSPEKLRQTLDRIFPPKDRRFIRPISIRGGEPTRNPEIAKIVEVANHVSDQVYLETHGRWLLNPEEIQRHSWLLTLSRALSVRMKLSFDSMHGLSPDDLRKITATLDQHRVIWMVAITEPDLRSFRRTWKNIPWVHSHQLIFQRKAKSASDLVKPRLGVIQVDGSHSGVLTTKKTFQTSDDQSVPLPMIHQLVKAPT